MTLLELSACYRESGVAIKLRIEELRAQQKLQSEDIEAVRALERRIIELTPLLREMRELEKLTAHYYDRGYHRNEKYTL